jgi:hypothetical protein
VRSSKAAERVRKMAVRVAFIAKPLFQVRALARPTAITRMP